MRRKLRKLQSFRKFSFHSQFFALSLSIFPPPTKGISILFFDRCEKIFRKIFLLTQFCWREEKKKQHTTPIRSLPLESLYPTDNFIFKKFNTKKILFFSLFSLSLVFLHTKFQISVFAIIFQRRILGKLLIHYKMTFK